jgi:dienelactone hydrolase
MMRIAVGSLLLVLVGPTMARASESIPITIRGTTLRLTYYRPAAPGPPRGTIFMGSGDVGWVGLATDLADEFSARGYAVVGINVRQYLSAFRTDSAHLTTDQIPGDYAAIAAFLRERGLLFEPVVLSGVSEGAALAVLAASSPQNHAWISGVITMGLPRTAELAWRWRDATSWITKRDANEPSFEPSNFIASVAPVPLWMIQSTRDEYVPEADYRMFERIAREPRRLILIQAANHRFTDRRPELTAQFLAGLEWIRHPS